MSEEIKPTPEPLLETPIPVESEIAAPALSTTIPPQDAQKENIESKPRWRSLVAPAWFFLGILVGLGIFAAYAQFTAAPPPQTLNRDEVKQAAREGLVEAIQELQAQTSGNNEKGPQSVDKNAFAVRDANMLGNKGAPVTVVEFADFQCPFCGRHHALVEPTIREFVDAGKVNMLYKHLAFLGPESVYAAVAAECAADQGKFWAFHDYLFEHQQGENEGAFEKAKLIGFGKELGLDPTRFDKCVNSDETLSRVQADTEEAKKLGVGSTPTFFVNGKPLVGLKSPDEFRQAIQAALNQ